MGRFKQSPTGLLQLLPIFVTLICCSVDLIGANDGGGLTETQQLQALFVFGDSLLDPGNDEKLVTLARANRPPYGRDFGDHKPTGRFCNGLLTTDFIAQLAGLPYPPAYLLDKTNILNGASFASSGAGVLNLTGYQLLQRINFFQQVSLFGEARQELDARLGPSAAAELVSQRSIFFINLGNNDYLTGYFGNPVGNSSLQRKYTPDAYRELLISVYASNVEALLQQGARKIAISGLSAIGCIPLERLLTRRRWHGGCNDEVNAEVQRFNAGLQALTQQMQSAYGYIGAKFTYLNSFDVAYEIIQNPSSHGFLSGSEACCGAGPFRGLPCYRPLSSVCDDATQYVFWDFAHPTQTMNSILASSFWSSSPPSVIPYNLQQLASL